MNVEYEAFCIADPVFYDAPGSGSGDHHFELARRESPPGWTRHKDNEWVMLSPEPCPLPAQGWKVHLSARLDNSEHIIETAWDYCTARGIPFKFLDSLATVLSRNSKYAGRGGSGKVVTIYPLI